MRPVFLSCLLLLASSPASAQQRQDTVADVQAQVAAAVTAYMAAGRIPGMSVAIGRAGQVLFARGFGQADLEHAVPVTTSTVFGLQSATKLLTSAAVLRLAQAGRIDLDAPVQRYCPAFGYHRWTVTPRQLLTHQAGVRASDLRDLFNRDHYDSPREALRRFARDSLRYEPGTQVVYSNAGYTLLACAIEGASGESYDAALTNLVLSPAGMHATRPDNVFEVIPSKTRYYMVRTEANTRQWEGLWTPAHLSATRIDEPSNADPVDPSWALGAGNYLGTPTDLVRFALSLMAGSLLDPTHRALDFADAPLAATGSPTGRTLGDWVVRTDRDGVLQVLGSSWNGSFGLAVVPSIGLAVAVASNVELDQPADLVGRIIDAWSPQARSPHGDVTH